MGLKEVRWEQNGIKAGDNNIFLKRFIVTYSFLLPVFFLICCEMLNIV